MVLDEWSAIRKLGTKNKRCRRFLQRSFRRYRFARIHFSPTSRCTFYMGLIDPFRKWIIYPAMLKTIRATWDQNI
jgi:hypothetical protein